MKTTIQWLEDYLNQKILPCPEGNDYVYGMNVAHENLINYVIPALKEKEKEQIKDAWDAGMSEGIGTTMADLDYDGEFINYYNQTFNQNK